MAVGFMPLCLIPEPLLFLERSEKWGARRIVQMASGVGRGAPLQGLPPGNLGWECAELKRGLPCMQVGDRKDEGRGVVSTGLAKKWGPWSSS